MVEADDGVMPQTLEAIQHARKANVPLIVALSKMDKANINPEKVKRELTMNGVELEEIGGSVQCIPISSKSKAGLDVLKDAILVQSEVMELVGDPTGPAEGDVIEAKVVAGLGPVASILVKKGVIKSGTLYCLI